MLVTLSVWITPFVIFTLAHEAPADPQYLIDNVRHIIIRGIGFFITFVGFYWLYNQQGTANYIVYTLLSILTTSIGVGLIIFREPFNKFHMISGILPVSANPFYGLGQSLLAT